MFPWSKFAKLEKKHILGLCHGSLYYQPKQCTIIGGSPQNHYAFALFDPPKMANLMILYASCDGDDN